MDMKKSKHKFFFQWTWVSLDCKQWELTSCVLWKSPSCNSEVWGTFTTVYFRVFFSLTFLFFVFFSVLPYWMETWGNKSSTDVRYFITKFTFTPLAHFYNRFKFMLETYNDVKTLHTLTSTVHRIQVGIIGNTLLLCPQPTHPHLIFLNFSSYVSFSIFLGFLKCVEIQFKEKGWANGDFLAIREMILT